MKRIAFALPLLALTACVGSTGGDLFAFRAAARGPDGADGSSYTFTSGRGYRVTLTRGKLHVGAAYLNESVPTSVSSDTTCTLAGIYVAEVTSGRDVDLLSADPQPFPVLGSATTDRAMTGEVWLNGRDVNVPNDRTPILDVAGSAEKDGLVYPFEGVLTIGTNRQALTPPATPGAKPICKERIVTPITVDLIPLRDGQLTLTIDPKPMFDNIDFSTLAEGDGGVRHFVDDPSKATAADTALYHGMHAATAYHFAWSDP